MTVRKSTGTVGAALAALVFVACAVLAASCSTGGAAPKDSGADTTPAGPCGPNTLVMCNGTCVNTQSDSQNCGTCGKACTGGGEVCSHGSCVTECGGGSFKCGSTCVDTKSDPKNCGTCGKVCDPGQVCSAASCAASCQAGLTDCNSACVDTVTDDANCGGCGIACDAGQKCVNSVCQATCSTGWTSCPNGDSGTTCVDLQHDPNNCGACGATCTGGTFCTPGAGDGGAPGCSLQCFGGSTLCGSACVDTTIDPSHCGACAVGCGTGNTCTNSHCCTTGDVYCAGACRTLSQCIALGVGRIAAGAYHTCAINGAGVLKCWGYNVFGQLGDGSTNGSTTPVTASLSGATYVGAGYGHTCAVAGGTAYCWGYGTYGQLGNGSTGDKSSPTAVSGITTATRIDGGYHHSCALLSGGAVSCWGENFYGEVGDGTTTERDAPVSTGVTTAIDLNAGLSYHTCAILSDGTAECWGEGDYGEVGNGALNVNNPSPVAVSGLTGAASIGLGYIHSCAVLQNGGLKCWGSDQYGELGDGNTVTQSDVPVTANISGVIAVAGGGDGFYAHTCALLTSGAVECWGANAYGQLGNGTTTDSTAPVTAITGAIAIAAGQYHTCALLGTGQVACWGYNSDGELGDGTNTDSNVPVIVSGF